MSDEEPDFDAGGANDWGGVIWVVHGEVDVVVAAETEVSIDDQALVAALPTALDLTNFDGDPEMGDWT